jgi:hypothetical protein
MTGALSFLLNFDTLFQFKVHRNSVMSEIDVVRLRPDIPTKADFHSDPTNRKQWTMENFRLPSGESMLGPDAFLVPPSREFTQIVNSATKVYSYRFDEAMRDTYVNARSMMRDTFILGLLEERILPTINRDWHLTVEDEKDPFQVHVRDSLTKVVKRIKDFDAMRRQFMMGAWWGRGGNQWNFTRLEDLNNAWGIGNWDPLHGDSIQFTYDGVPAIMLDSMTTGWYARNGAKWGIDLRWTDRGGTALCLQRPYWRERFGIYQHIRQKADYFEGELAGSVQGFGLRGQVYWQYIARSDALTWMLAYMQAVGMMDLLVFNYPAGNEAARLQQIANAQAVIGKAAIVCPRNPQGNWPAIEQIQMNEAGLKALQNLVADYFDRNIERMIVGQSMSSGGGQMQGLGDTGRAFLAKATKDEILIHDANRHDNVLTYDLLAPLKRYNFPTAKFPVYFKSLLPNTEAAEKVRNGLDLVSIQVPIKMNELREAAGYAHPEQDDEVAGGPPPMMPMDPMGMSGEGAPPMLPAAGGATTFANAGGVQEPMPFSRDSWDMPTRFMGTAPGGMGTTPSGFGFPGGSNTYLPGGNFGKRQKKIGFTRYDYPVQPMTQEQPYPRVLVRGDTICVDTGLERFTLYPGDQLYSEWISWVAANRQKVRWASVSDPSIAPQFGQTLIAPEQYHNRRRPTHYKYYDQIFEDAGGAWKVPDIKHYINMMSIQPQALSVSKLAINNLKPGEEEAEDELPGHPEFIERADQTDLEFPIMVIRYPDGDWICDGVHRLWKARAKGMKTIEGYLITKNQLDEIPHRRLHEQYRGWKRPTYYRADTGGREHSETDGKFTNKKNPGGKGENTKRQNIKRPEWRSENLTDPNTRVSKILSHVKSVPRRTIDQAWKKVTGQYEKLKTKYGPTYARLIVGSAIATLPIPVPGISLATAGTITAIAMLHKRLFGNKKQPTQNRRLPFDPRTQARLFLDRCRMRRHATTS